MTCDRATACSCSLGALLSCSAPDISAEVTDHQSLLNDRAYAVCLCCQDVGFDTLDECGDAYPTVTSADRDCMSDALVGSEDQAQEYLACANMALQTYVQCLEGNQSCVDGQHQTCGSTHDAAMAACPALPSSAKAEFDICLP